MFLIKEDFLFLIETQNYSLFLRTLEIIDVRYKNREIEGLEQK